MKILTKDCLKGYVGTDLQMQIITNPLKYEIHAFSGIRSDGLVILGKGGMFGFIQRTLLDVKPLLYPIDTIGRYREDLGFMPMVELSRLADAVPPCEHIKNTFWITRSGRNNEGKILAFGALCKHVDQLALFEKLYEWHIDIHGLIEKGLAIDKSDYFKEK